MAVAFLIWNKGVEFWTKRAFCRISAAGSIYCFQPQSLLDPLNRMLTVYQILTLSIRWGTLPLVLMVADSSNWSCQKWREERSLHDYNKLQDLRSVPEDWRRWAEVYPYSQERTNFFLQLECWAGDLWAIKKKKIYQRLRTNLIWGKLIDWYFPGDFVSKKIEMTGPLQVAYSFSEPCTLICSHSSHLSSHQGYFFFFFFCKGINAKSSTFSVCTLTWI